MEPKSPAAGGAARASGDPWRDSAKPNNIGGERQRILGTLSLRRLTDGGNVAGADPATWLS